MTEPGPVVQRIWLSSYPKGVPAEIDAGAYRSCVDLFDAAIALHHARPAFVCMDRTMTYQALDERARHFAAWLQANDIPFGARVAIMMPNVLQYPIAILGILRAGCVVVNVNPLYTPRELEHQLADSGAEAIIVLENFAQTVQKVIARTTVRHVIVASLGELLGPFRGPLVNFVVRHIKKLVPAFQFDRSTSFRRTLAEGACLNYRAPVLGPNDIAFLQYTGGTTGVSKGATLLHRNIVANVLQSEAWMQPALEAGPPLNQVIIVCALPLYHIFALTVCCLLGVKTGGLNILITNPRDVRGVLAELKKYRVNILPAVNTLYYALLEHPLFASVDWTGLRVANGGGMAVQRSVAQRWFAATGCPIVEGYGLSETSPSVTCNPTNATEYNGTIGLPLPSTEIVIRDEHGIELPLGERGEICIRGPQVMAGYWNRPDETANAMYADGFLKSGDIGIMDARGYIQIVDRKKDMILVSGFNVYPSEIEAVVCMHPGVLECAAIGVPDEYSGELVKIFVVRRDPNLTEADLRAYLKDQLTGYKIPRAIEFRRDLPKSNVGKILRRELRDREEKKGVGKSID